MLIDASHPEETRVVVLDGQRVEEFDFEAASKRPLKGNIYLAKVTRVEPSLQAAFVEYGGNRQGFLAFSEIHPDYYQIPVADRLALLADQEAEARRRQEDEIESFEITSGPKPDKGEGDFEAEEIAASSDAETAEEFEETADEPGKEEADTVPAEEAPAASEEEIAAFAEPEEHDGPEADDAEPPQAGATPDGEASDEAYGGDDTPMEFFDPGDDHPDAMTDAVPAEPSEEHIEGESEAAPDTEAEPAGAEQALQAKRPSQRWMRRRHYKIQEVIKRRQVILVQVVKEERGNKGAALTTYLSLAGRYCVLMPNTPRGGGISRKITNANDRKRLKSAAQALDLPEGMGLIIRTAGENRTKVEIKRDYEYLLRLWDQIRELTLKSNAPACVYEEGDLIKRAIRDLYNKDVGEVVVEGDDGYRNAKDFMRMLMPSHAKNVKPFKEPVPLFQRHHIEAQLDAMFSPSVTLKSGGYIVINQTEALVAIDVNSGRATREHSIEETATKTNLEAADEIGRQLRLRDLAGLIVIDFIDMEDGRNDRAVEKRLHNAVKNDRARVQIGKISQFGLLEMSRQRLRAGVIAGSTVPCPHCGGQGIVRSVESTSLRVLRGLEEEAQKQRAEGLIVRVAADVAIYTLNQKRPELARLESEYDIAITFEPKEGLKAGDFEIDRVGQRDPQSRPRAPVEAEPEPVAPPEVESEPAEEEQSLEPQKEAPVEAQQQQTGEGNRRRRRRRRRGGRDRAGDRQDEFRPPQPTAPEAEDDTAQTEELSGPESEPERRPVQNGQPQHIESGAPPGEGGRRRRRRRRRGRRGGRDNIGGEQRGETHSPAYADNRLEDRFGRSDEIDTTPREEPRAQSAPVFPPAESQIVPNASSTPVWSLGGESSEALKPIEKRRVVEATLKPNKEPQVAVEPLPSESAAPASEPASESISATVPTPEPVQGSEPAQPAKKGWWQRAFRSN
jgi:ribonuclease E